jgi:hypothetical protein
MSDKEGCQEPRSHKAHLCKLLKHGEMEELDRRRTQPTVICCRCGFTANDAHDVCQPRPL